MGCRREVSNSREVNFPDVVTYLYPRPASKSGTEYLISQLNYCWFAVSGTSAHRREVPVKRAEQTVPCSYRRYWYLAWVRKEAVLPSLHPPSAG